MMASTDGSPNKKTGAKGAKKAAPKRAAAGKGKATGAAPEAVVEPGAAAKADFADRAAKAKEAMAKAAIERAAQARQAMSDAGAQLQADVEGQVSQAALQDAALKMAGDKVALMGNATWLLTQTQTHRHLFITDLEWLLMPPLALNQFRLWRKGAMPVAFATWAFLSDEAEERLKQGIRRIAPMDWKSGENLWLMDLIAPFGGQDEALAELKDKIFEGRTIKTLQPSPAGDGSMAVVEW